MLIFDPMDRITADQAIRHDFFKDIFEEEDLRVEFSPNYKLLS